MLSIDIAVNTSPLAGKEGSKFTSNAIKERLLKESENDVALRIDFGDGKANSTIEVQGRGDLHLGILIEKLRREGYEMSITPPKVVFKNDGKTVTEPIEVLNIEIGHEYSASVIENVNNRKGTLISCDELSADKQR